MNENELPAWAQDEQAAVLRYDDQTYYFRQFPGQVWHWMSTMAPFPGDSWKVTECPVQDLVEKHGDRLEVFARFV